jgi:hypothetical protein
MNNNKVTHQKILEPHFKQTAIKCSFAPVVLAIQDTTILNFAHHPDTQGLGPVNKRRDKGLGMLVHSVFTLDGQTKEPLGLLHQDVFVRKGWYPENEVYIQRLKRQRESEKWFKGCRDIKKYLPSQTKVIEIADREADIFFDAIKKAKVLGTGQINVARNGNRKERTAKVEIRACTVNMIPPRVVGHKGKNLSVNVVVVEEIDIHKETESLYWVLLTNEPTDNYEDAWKVMNFYQARWIIEEFHKGLKTGCQIEQRQLGSRHGLENALALFSAIAVQLLYIRQQASLPETTVETSICLSKSQLKIIQSKFPKDSQDLTPKKILILIARLGGFIGRKSDGDPGWQTLMRGFNKLLIIDYGFHLAQKDVGNG